MLLNLQQASMWAAALALVLPAAAQTVPVPRERTAELLASTDYNQLDAAAKVESEHGRYDLAEKLSQRALEARQEKFGANSAEFAAGLVNLAGVYRGGARFWARTGAKRDGEAADLYRRALAIQEAALGANHPDVADTLYHLAIEAQAARQLGKALELYQRVLDIRTKAFGPVDAKVGEVLTVMALLKNDEALYRRALDVVNASGQQSAQGATTMELYAGFLKAHDRASEAVSLESRAKLIRAASVEGIGSKHGARSMSGPYKVGSGVTAPRLVSKIEPEYTEEARLSKLQGTVILTMEVGVDGLAHNIQLKQGIGLGLDESAASAVNQWTFQPGTKDGQAVNVQATVEVGFKLL